MRFGRRDLAAGEQQFNRLALADQPRQTLRPGISRNQAEQNLWLSELRGLGRESQCAGHRQLAAAAEREAVNCRDDRLAEGLEQVEHVLAGQRVLAPAGRRLDTEFVDVGAGHERLVAGSGHDQHADGDVLLQFEDRPPQFVERLRIERVQHLGTIDGENRDGAIPIDEKVVESHLSPAGTETSASPARRPTPEIRRTSSPQIATVRAPVFGNHCEDQRHEECEYHEQEKVARHYLRPRATS